MHWASEVIGRLWVAGGRGPDAFDCWGLVVWVQGRHYGRTLPAIPAENLRSIVANFGRHPERRRWQRVAAPADGDGVLLRQARYSVHAGVWLACDGGGVLHCVQGAGVVFQKPRDLIAAGWRIEGFYRFTGD